MKENEVFLFYFETNHLKFHLIRRLPTYIFKTNEKISFSSFFSSFSSFEKHCKTISGSDRIIRSWNSQKFIKMCFQERRVDPKEGKMEISLPKMRKNWKKKEKSPRFKKSSNFSSQTSALDPLMFRRRKEGFILHCFRPKEKIREMYALRKKTKSWLAKYEKLMHKYWKLIWKIYK